MSAELGSSETAFLGVRMAFFSLCLHTVSPLRVPVSPSPLPVKAPAPLD